MLKQFLRSSLLLIILNGAFQLELDAYERSGLSLQAKDGLFHSPRGHFGHKGKRGRHGKRGKRGVTGCDGATGATGATGTGGIITTSGYVFAGTRPGGSGSFVTFINVGALTGGVTFNNPGPSDTFTVPSGGDYRISYILPNSVNPGQPDPQTTASIFINGVPSVPNSAVFLRKTAGAVSGVAFTQLVYEGIFTLTAGSTVQINSVGGSVGINGSEFMILKLN